LHRSEPPSRAQTALQAVTAPAPSGGGPRADLSSDASTLSVAGVLKAQYPELEMFNQGTHAQAGVACAGCHMPYRSARRGQLNVQRFLPSDLAIAPPAPAPVYGFTVERATDRPRSD